MPDNVIDLNILRPEKRTVIFNDKEIDTSFIPVGITFEIDEIVKKLSKLSMEKVKNGEETEKALELGIELCEVFCSYKYPELNKQWFKDNLSVWQIQVFTEEIKRLLMEAYEGVEAYGKKAEAINKGL